MYKAPLALTTLAAGALCVSIAGCSHGGKSTPAPSVTTASSAVSTITSAPSSDVTQLPSATPVAPAATPTPAPASDTAAGNVLAGCSTSALAVTVADHGSGGQQNFALISFRNTSAAACTLTGFPGVSLYAAGAKIGSDANRSNNPIKTIQLAPNATATALLTDDTSCNAPLSDTVRIYPPNQTQSVDVAYEACACTLIIAPVALA